MTDQEIRTGFDQMITAAKTAGDHDAVARLEIGREFFADPEFKTALQEHVWQLNDR